MGNSTNQDARLLVPLTKLKFYPGNARRGDLSLLTQSLTQLGQYRPLIVQKSTGHVLVGNNTMRAMQALHWKEAWVAYEDCDDETASKINLVDNRANDLSDYEWEELAKQLESLDDLTATGYTPEVVEALLEDIRAQTEDVLDAANEMAAAQVAAAQSDEKVPRSDPLDDTFDGISPDLKGVLALKEGVIFPGDEHWDIPELLPEMLVQEVPQPLDTWSGPESSNDDGMTTWITIYSTDSTRGMPWDRSILAFYVQDHRFENWWVEPSHYVARMLNAGCPMAIEPDFSQWEAWPRAVKLHNVYRNRWLARYMQEAGIKVIPNIVWGDPGDEDWVLAGYPAHVPVVAMQVQTHRDTNAEDKRYFHFWLKLVEQKLSPKQFIIYGNAKGHTLARQARLKAELVCVENRSAKKNAAKAARAEAGQGLA